MAFSLVRYSQQDPQWKDARIGHGPDTIGYVGCALTSLAMYSSSWGFTETPATLNQKLTAIGGITSDEALVWSAISRIYSQIQSTGLTICTNSDAPIQQINTSLLVGQPVIVEVDYAPDAGLQTHWVLLYARQGNDYLIQDPWPFPQETTPVTLMTRFAHGQPLLRTIKAVAWYTCSSINSTPSGGNTSGSTSTTPSTSQTGLYVQPLMTATAGLRLHTQPSSDSPANYAEMPGVPLKVIEDQTGALAKIGVNNQWINVADPSGHQGYIAAWFVQQVPGTSPATTSTTSTSSTPSTTSTPGTSSSSTSQTGLYVQVLATITAGLRMHTQPSSDSTANYAEMPGVPLKVIEDQTGALAKIGTNNQWINVADPSGHQGYVAAWCVQQVPGSSPASTSTTSSTSSTPSTSSTSTQDSSSSSTSSSSTSSSSSSSTSSTSTQTSSTSSQAPASKPERLMLKVLDTVGSSGLRLRAFPSLAGRLVGVEKGGTFLTVIEPTNTALAKVGVANQWINVRDPNGLRGYVMSSYVAVA